MKCDLENNPTTWDRIYTTSVSIATWIGGFIALTIVSGLMGNPIKLSALVFIYIALAVSNNIPKLNAWLRNRHYWNKWERLQIRKNK